MDDFLKGNFKVKNEVKEKASPSAGQEKSLKENLRAAALHTIGGSMVYMEREMLSWEDNEKK